MVDGKLTVLQILPALDSGGVERGALELGAELVRQEYQSLVMSAGGRMVERIQAQGSEHIKWPVGKKSLLTLRWIPRLRRLMRERQVDIVHARSRLPAWITYLAWRGMDPKTRPRLVTTVHGFYTVNRYSAVMTYGERVIAVSESVRDYVFNNYPKVKRDCVTVIHRGVDQDIYPAGFRPSESWLISWYRQYPQLEQKYVITLPARLTRLKGQEDFIAVIARLKQRGFPVYGLLVGGAHPSKQKFVRELEKKIEQAGLTDCISLVGHRNDMREILAVSDVVLSLSTSPESFGRTTIEALSMGRPVVGYDHGGVAEQLTTLLPEGLVPVGDIEAVVEKLASWHGDPPFVSDRQVFTLECMLSKTLDVYRDLMRSTR